jgi:thioredoxin reductase (NADPH)
VQGGDDTALEAALALIDLPATSRPASVTLIHRRDVFQAEIALVERMRQAVSLGRLNLCIGQISALHAKAEQLQRLSIITAQGETHEVDADQLVAFLGVSPKLGPVAEWGLEMARKQLVVDPQDCSTSQPGIYAVGDINTYPGKKKLIVCGFHEATMAAFGVLARLQPDRPALLQYTTTSTELKKRLGVA